MTALLTLHFSVVPERIIRPAFAKVVKLTRKKCKTIPNRGQRPMDKMYRFGPYRLDPEAGILFRGNSPTSLGKRAVALLQLLIGRKGMPVSKQELVDAGWPGLSVEDSNLTVQIAGLRRLFEKEDSGGAWIETMSRRGYRYVGPAVVTDEDGPAATSYTEFLARPVLAVLPFENMSSDPEQTYFVDGLTEDIITALSLWRSFPVIARNSTVAFRDKAVNVRKIGQELGARYVLEGSVRKANGRIRVSAQLVDTQTSHQVWAETFDRQVTDLFELQDDLTKKIAAVVTPELEWAEYRRLLAHRPHNLDAWYFVQRGTAELDEYTREGNRRARELFAQAIELDPNYGRAFAGMALSYNRDLMLGYANSSVTAADNALQYARKAVALDRSDSFAHSVLGMAHLWSGQQSEAKLLFERAVELNPSHGYARASLGNILDLMGQSQEGISMMEDGLRLNPNAPNMRHIHTFLARALIRAHRYADAVESARRGVNADAQNPNTHYLLAAGLAHLGRVEEGAAALYRCERIQPGFVAARAGWRPYQDSVSNEHILNGIHKIGWKP